MLVSGGMEDDLRFVLSKDPPHLPLILDIPQDGNAFQPGKFLLKLPVDLEEHCLLMVEHNQFFRLELSNLATEL